MVDISESIAQIISYKSPIRNPTERAQLELLTSLYEDFLLNKFNNLKRTSRAVKAISEEYWRFIRESPLEDKYSKPFYHLVNAFRDLMMFNPQHYRVGAEVLKKLNHFLLEHCRSILGAGNNLLISNLQNEIYDSLQLLATSNIEQILPSLIKDVNSEKKLDEFLKRRGIKEELKSTELRDEFEKTFHKYLVDEKIEQLHNVNLQRGIEIDFILSDSHNLLITIECKTGKQGLKGNEMKKFSYASNLIKSDKKYFVTDKGDKTTHEIKQAQETAEAYGLIYVVVSIEKIPLFVKSLKPKYVPYTV